MVSRQKLGIVGNDISPKFSFVHAFENKNGLGRSNEMKGSAFERGDLDGSLEKGIKSFGEVLVKIWRLKVK